MNSENLLKIIFESNIDRAIVLEKCIKNKRIIKKQKNIVVNCNNKLDTFG